MWKNLLLAVLLVLSIGSGTVVADPQNPTGDDVKVGIIDETFDLDADIQGNDLSFYTDGSKAFYSENSSVSKFDDRKSHGTGVSEIVINNAGDSRLYLAAVENLRPQNFSNAVDWMIENDVDVVVASIGYWGQPYDGSGEVSQAVQRAWDNNITFVSSAGNEAQKHWEGEFAQRNQWEPENTLDNGEFFTVYFSEANWSTSSGAYNVTIEDKDTGEVLDYQILNPSLLNNVNNEGNSDWVALQVEKSAGQDLVARATQEQSGTDNRIEVFFRSNGMNNPNATGSIVAPASADDVIAVGAVGNDGDLEPFSSHGPTADGGLGIDVVALNGQNLTAYESPSGSTRFFGTSAAAPVVAAAAARIIEKDPNATPEKIEQVIQMTAQGQGTNFSHGHGRLSAKGAVGQGKVIVTSLQIKRNRVNYTAENPGLIREYKNLKLRVDGEVIREDLQYVNSSENKSFSVSQRLNYIGQHTVSVNGFSEQVNLESPYNRLKVNFTEGASAKINEINFSSVTQPGETVLSITISQETTGSQVTLDGLESGRTYFVYRDGNFYTTRTASSEGEITWTHSGATNTYRVFPGERVAGATNNTSVYIFFGGIAVIILGMGAVVLQSRSRVDWV